MLLEAHEHFPDLGHTAHLIHSITHGVVLHSPAVLLNTYAHFLPTELAGLADAIAAPDGPIRPSTEQAGRSTHPASVREPLRYQALPWWALRGSNPGPLD